MKRIVSIFSILAMATTLGVVVEAPAGGGGKAQEKVVLVELFTSQG